MKCHFDKEYFKRELNEFLNPIKTWNSFVKSNPPENLAEAIVNLFLAIITPLLAWVALPITILITILLSTKIVPVPLKKIK